MEQDECTALPLPGRLLPLAALLHCPRRESHKNSRGLHRTPLVPHALCHRDFWWDCLCSSHHCLDLIMHFSDLCQMVWIGRTRVLRSGATEANRARRRSAEGSTRAERKDAMCSPGGGCMTTVHTPCTRRLHALTCRTSWRAGSMAGRMRSTRGGDGSLMAATWTSTSSPPSLFTWFFYCVWLQKHIIKLLCSLVSLNALVWW